MKPIEIELQNLLWEADAGGEVYITRLRELFDAAGDDGVEMVARLTIADDEMPRDFPMTVPLPSTLSGDTLGMVREYLCARVYNIISTYGGRLIRFYRPSGNADLDRLLDDLAESFGPDRSKKDRPGYGRCLNVAERTADAMDGAAPGSVRFRFERTDISDYEPVDSPSPAAPGPVAPSLAEALIALPDRLAGKVILGMDVGGSDIKMVLADDGEIIAYKEHDWFPARFTESRQLVDTVLLMARWARVRAAVQSRDDGATWREELDAVSHADVPEERVAAVVEQVETAAGDSIPGLDAIGLCFPDVVVRDKIVGGEVYKTRGIRNNPAIDYEADFRQLTDLNNRLAEYVKPGAPVKNINDGPMAAFTAGVEMAFSGRGSAEDGVNNGVFAHTLGTELGTGWLDAAGGLPEIPLEVYNYVIDLGSRGERRYDSDDPRSLNNFNTGIPGTLQKYVSQSGVFRLAIKYFKEGRPELYQELFDAGFLEQGPDDRIHIVQNPNDMRKPFLEHLMTLPEREKDPLCDEIFRKIGEYLAVTWDETRRILEPRARGRILFGRLVKNPVCFRLMREGADRIVPELELIVADDESAWTPLMKQLRDDDRYTVAQFAQAVGAVHYAVT